MYKEKHVIGYNIFKYLLGLFFLLYYRPKFIGKENIPNEGPIIVCGNHRHLYDQCLPILSTKRMLHYMAKKEYFDNPKVAWFFKLAGCISVNRQIKDTSAKEQAMDILERGQAIGIFPEGTRNKTTNKLLPFKYGAVSMAQKTGASIVPFAITGHYRFKNNNLQIRFGKPFKVENMTLEDANERLTQTISNLIDMK